MKNKKINIHAGHNPSGKMGCGAVDILDESKEARSLVKKVIPLLQEAGITIYDCTCNNGTSQGDILKRIVQKCNAGRNDHSGDGKVGGTEVWMRTEEGIKKKVGQRFVKKWNR